MRVEKNNHVIQNLDDWLRFAPPKQGERHWKGKRSAKELARWWTEQPERASQTLCDLLASKLGSVRLVSAEPERVIRIDKFRGESPNRDLVIQAVSAQGSVCIHVEAKADEVFDSTIGAYYDTKSGTRSKVPLRIENLLRSVFLSEELTPALRGLRYQLLNGVYGAVIDAERSGARAAVFVVHCFHSEGLSKKKVEQNRADWDDFLVALLGSNFTTASKEHLHGPVSIQGEAGNAIPLYLGQLMTRLV